MIRERSCRRFGPARWFRVLMPFLLVSLLLVLQGCDALRDLFGGAEPVEVFVDAETGSDSNDGSASAPFGTITHAVSLVSRGHKVHVSPGTYDTANGEIFPIVLPEGVLLIGDEANKGQGTTPTVIFGGDADPETFIGTTIDPRNDSVIAGFTIIGDQDAAATFSMNIAITYDRITLRNNSFVDGNTGIYLYSGSSDLVITGNIVSNNSSLGLGFIGGGFGSRVENNVFAGNGIGVEYDSPGGDMGGGSAGSSGGNTLSGNSRNDLWTNSGVVIYAENNYWDHVPPTESDGLGGGIDIRKDTVSIVHTEGALLAD